MSETHIISLGAGVQSSTLALMAAHGEVTPMPSKAIFADTQAEPESVYRWLDWLETQLPFPVERVTAGSLADEALRVRTARADAHQYVKGTIPAFLRYADGGRGISMRQCTSDFKIAPILRAMRPTRGNTVVQWIGISLDEAHRMKPARDSWLTSRWPLIEQRMTRNDCLRWLEARGYPRPPRSACVFCPFHNDAEWREMRDADPDGFARAVAFDAQYRATMATIPSHRGEAYLHHSLVPLSEVRFAADYQTNLFGNECEGVCGV